MTQLLRDLWYFAAPARDVGRRKVIGLTLLGEPVLVGRDAEGAVFAMRDVCPHRAMILSEGRFDGETIECPYHGWRFGTDGVCREIPSLIEGQKFNIDRVKTPTYPCVEVQGNIWVFMGEDPHDVPPVPVIEEVRGHKPYLHHVVDLNGSYDDAVIGLIDPAHTPFVHNNWYWRNSKTHREKVKHYVPSELGFTMKRHVPSKNSKIIRMLGSETAVEISFHLPGIRVERLTFGKHAYVGMTAMTPAAQNRTRMHHVIYLTPWWARLFRPLVSMYMKSFLAQDARAMNLQAVGMAHASRTMLIDDADRLAKWYLAVKKEYGAARSENRPFENPVKETELRWRT